MPSHMLDFTTRCRHQLMPRSSGGNGDGGDARVRGDVRDAAQ